MEPVSLFVSSALDDLGYNEEMVIYRSNTIQQIQNTFNDSPIRNDFETLIDQTMSEVLLIKKDVICVSNLDTRIKLGENQVTFVLDRSKTRPGYALLIRTQNSQKQVDDEDIMCSTFGTPPCLWGNFYFNKMKGNLGRNTLSNSKTRQVIGPMLNHEKGNFNFPLNLIDSDTVMKVKRKLRLPNVIQAVCPADGFVYPDSSSGSDISYSEWRMSYTRTEQRLFQTLNITQIKLYVLLKLIGKSTLYEISTEMNAYVMKNIVFWMTYLCKPEYFEEQNLVSLLVTALGVLYNCVKSGFIPCFMTEERNLLTKPMETPRKHDLLRMLSILQQENATMLLRCEKLRCVMLMKFKSPHIVDMYQRQRDRLEQLLLLLEFIQARHTAKTNNVRAFLKGVSCDKDWIEVARAVYDMVLPGWERLYFAGENVPDIVIKHIREILG